MTTDQNIRYQQNLAARQIALIVLRKARWDIVKSHLSEIAAAVDAAAPGSYAEVEIREANRLRQRDPGPTI